jgi:antibiotic biosynthesis monooxygenase (ABM) superfamily enzyme
MSVHVAITRQVRPGCETEFQQALAEFFQASFSHGGVLGASMLVPPPGSGSREHGILRTFASEAERDAFYASPQFQRWEARARKLTEGEAHYRDLHGLEAWFRESDQPKPPRWKMGVATLAGVYPTSLMLGTLVIPHLHGLPHALSALIVGSCMVICLTWIVMPVVTRLLHRWLHPQA